LPSAAHTVTDELDDDAIAQRLAQLQAGIDPDAQQLIDDVAEQTGMVPVDIGAANVAARAILSRQRHFFTPFEEAAGEYVAWSRSPGTRIYTGIDEFDSVMRGVAPKELCLIVGYAHSGKTVFTTQVLLHNKHRRIALFTPDETRVLVLVKLASILYGVSAEEIEQRLYSGDSEMEEELRDVARRHFPNLAVFDELSELGAMDKALDEVEAHWGDKCEAIVIDYADLITGVGEDVPSKMNAIKAWGKKRNCAVFLLHQTSRTSGSAGRKMKIDSGGFGGEQQALFLIGVRRKKNQYLALIEELEEKIATSGNPNAVDRYEDQLRTAQYELQCHENTITFSLVKNKRPPSRLVDDTDFVLDAQTGRVQKLGHAAHTETEYVEAEGMF
jgi:archaellum biogenesis ATPase FlaH